MDFLQNKTAKQRQELLKKLQDRSKDFQQKTMDPKIKTSEAKKYQSQLEECNNAILLVREYSLKMDCSETVCVKKQQKSFKSSLNKSTRKSAEKYLEKSANLLEEQPFEILEKGMDGTVTSRDADFKAVEKQKADMRYAGAKQNYDIAHNAFLKEKKIKKGENPLLETAIHLHIQQKSIQGAAFAPYRKKSEEEFGSGAYSRLIAPMLHYYQADEFDNPVNAEADKYKQENQQVLNDIFGETDKNLTDQFRGSYGEKLLENLIDMPTPDLKWINENETSWPKEYAKYNSLILTFSNYTEEIEKFQNHKDRYADKKTQLPAFLKPMMEYMSSKPKEWQKLSDKMSIYTKISGAFALNCTASGVNIDYDKNWYAPVPAEVGESFKKIGEENLHGEGGAATLLRKYIWNYDEEFRGNVKQQYEEHLKNRIRTDKMEFFAERGGIEGYRVYESGLSQLPQVVQTSRVDSKRMPETIMPLIISENLESYVSEEQMQKVKDLYMEAFAMKENEKPEDALLPERVAKQKEYIHAFYDHLEKQVNEIEKRLDIKIEDGRLKQIHEIDGDFLANNYEWCAMIAHVGANSTSMDMEVKHLIKDYPEQYGDLKSLLLKGDYISNKFVRYTTSLFETAKIFGIKDNFSETTDASPLEEHYQKEQNELYEKLMKDAYAELLVGPEYEKFMSSLQSGSYKDNQYKVSERDKWNGEESACVTEAQNNYKEKSDGESIPADLADFIGRYNTIKKDNRFCDGRYKITEAELKEIGLVDYDRLLTGYLRTVNFDKDGQPISDNDKLNHITNLKTLAALKEHNDDAMLESVQTMISDLLNFQVNIADLDFKYIKEHPAYCVEFSRLTESLTCIESLVLPGHENQGDVKEFEKFFPKTVAFMRKVTAKNKANDMEKLIEAKFQTFNWGMPLISANASGDGVRVGNMAAYDGPSNMSAEDRNVDGFTESLLDAQKEYDALQKKMN